VYVKSVLVIDGINSGSAAKSRIAAK